MQVVRHFHGQKYGTAENASIRNREDAYDSIQFYVVPFLVTHRIIFVAQLLFLLIVVSRNVFYP